MGKPRRPKGQNKSKKGEARSDHRDNQPRGSAAINKSNAAFEAYYKAQAILDTDEEFDRMMSSYREDLHTTFRVTGSRAYGATLGFAREVHALTQSTVMPRISTI